MPVFALKASRTFWKFSCSAPPQRDVTVIVPPAAGLPPPPLPDAAGEDAPPVLPAGEAVPPPFEHAMRSADTTISVAPRRDRFIKNSTDARRLRPVGRTRLHERFVRIPHGRPGRSSSSDGPSGGTGSPSGDPAVRGGTGPRTVESPATSPIRSGGRGASWTASPSERETRCGSIRLSI